MHFQRVVQRRGWHLEPGLDNKEGALLNYLTGRAFYFNINA
jgi:hypothetical protein